MTSVTSAVGGCVGLRVVALQLRRLDGQTLDVHGNVEPHRARTAGRRPVSARSRWY